jgi:hypothetical protein
MLHKDYSCKGSVEKKKSSGCESQGAVKFVVVFVFQELKVKHCRPVAQMHISHVKAISEFTQNLSQDWERFSTTSSP